MEVNIQLNDGKRIKKEFQPQTSLFDIMSAFETEDKSVKLSTHSTMQPVFIYVNEQVGLEHKHSIFFAILLTIKKIV